VERLSRFERSAGWTAASPRSMVTAGDRSARKRARRGRFLSERIAVIAASLSAPGTALRAGSSEPDRTLDSRDVWSLACLSGRVVPAREARAAVCVDASIALRALPGSALPLRLPGGCVPERRVRSRCLREPRPRCGRNRLPGKRLPREARLPCRSAVPLRAATGALSHERVSAFGRGRCCAVRWPEETEGEAVSSIQAMSTTRCRPKTLSASPPLRAMVAQRVAPPIGVHPEFV
jgi:hypothetical protein